MTSPLSTTMTIEQGRNILTLVNTFDVDPASQDTLVAELSAVTEASMRHLPGFLGASVHKSLDGRRVINYVQWEKPSDFEAMFHEPAAKAHMERVTALALSVTPVLYSVAYVGARPV
jgi:quinol monooxygenase YgiN